MFGFLFFAVLLMVSGVAYYSYLVEIEKASLAERLGFGISPENEDSQENLAAGDYGLQGKEKFYYYLQTFFESWQGRLFLFGIGASVFFAFGFLVGFKIDQIVLVTIAGGLLILAISITLLFSRKKKRARLIRMELPNALELTAALMEGGLAFEASLTYLLLESDKTHPLYFELEIVREAMQRGRRRADALRLWAQRCNQQEVMEVSSALIQAEQTSAALGSILRHHATAMRRENEGEIQRRAERLPIRMLLPMVFTILPAVIVVAAMPSMLKIVRVMESIMAGG